MTIENRETFLDNLAHHLNRPRRSKDVQRPTWHVQPQHDVFHDLTQDELIDILEAQCESIHTQFKQTTTKDLTHVLEATLADYQATSIITSKDDRFKTFNVLSLFDTLKENGLSIHEWDAELGKENQQFAEQADIGISFSDITLAESGTVTLFNDKDHGRSISLLPQAYIAIIPKSTLVPRLTQATTHLHQNRENVASCVSFVSGPSNSADIEMNLVVGVHGPIHVTYIVVND